jgi:hypothetical protein
MNVAASPFLCGLPGARLGNRAAVETWKYQHSLLVPRAASVKEARRDRSVQTTTHSVRKQAECGPTMAAIPAILPGLIGTVLIFMKALEFWSQ